jgi:NADPH-dependent 2,4-dienoyl-CoA reductase/sulfur reductase-like enzyme
VDLVIVGNGVAGITCALETRKRDPSANITVVGGETDHIFSRTALMYAFMDKLQRRELEPYERSTWQRERINLVRDWVVDVDAAGHTVTLQGGKKLPWDRLVLALGARPRDAAWPGMAAVKDGVVNLVSMQDLDACERLTPTTREAVVVGGGLIGIELVECLIHFKVKTHFLIREKNYWPVALGPQESQMVEERLRAHGVDVRTGDEVKEVHADASGRFSGVTTALGERLNGQMLGVSIGVEPNLTFPRKFSAKLETGRGIRVNEKLETSIPGVFACGDCAEIVPAGGKPYVELIWYSAKRQGGIVARNLLGEDVPYTPPVFFNSSKFLDVEFTTVGQVMDVPAGTPSIYRHLPGTPVSQRVVHDGKRVLGFNMLGSRWDHAVLSRWVEEERSPEYCLQHLNEAQFDVEFGRVDLAAMVEVKQ